MVAPVNCDNFLDMQDELPWRWKLMPCLMTSSQNSPQLVWMRYKLFQHSSWGDLPGEEFMKAIYDTYAHWRPNLFKIPSGACGKQFVAELTRLFNALPWNLTLHSRPYPHWCSKNTHASKWLLQGSFFFKVWHVSPKDSICVEDRRCDHVLDFGTLW